MLSLANTDVCSHTKSGSLTRLGPAITQLYWFTTYNTDRDGNAADGRPAPSTPEEAKADALASVTGWGGGVEAAIERTDVADITRNRIADRWGQRSASGAVQQARDAWVEGWCNA